MRLTSSAGKSKMARRWMGISTFAVILSLFSVSVASPAQADSAESNVKTLTIEAGNATIHSTLSLSFDAEGISKAEADKLRTSLSTAVDGPSTLDDYNDRLACWNSVSHIDGNGTFDLQYYCGATRTLPWGFKLSRGVRSIVVGNIHERGLSWWRNSQPQPQNAPHVVPPDYRLHGTMLPVYGLDHIEYQDYISFRHNIGPGGTGVVTFAGRANLIN